MKKTPPRPFRLATGATLAFAVLLPPHLCAAWIWIEGEKPAKSTMNRHPWWYDQVQREQLSGGDLISNFHKDRPGEAEYGVKAPDAGDYEFWVRANPVQARLSYALNGGQWTPIDLQRGPVGTLNIASDGKVDLRFIAWVKVGKVPLGKGDNTIRFRMDSPNSNHGYLDCFVLSTEPFRPRGALRPDQAVTEGRRPAAEDAGWFPFDPKEDPFEKGAGFDLRSLNEKEAGEGGPIAVKGSQFVHSRTGEPVRFWAVNGPSGEARDRAALRQQARFLAKRGVNLVRIHQGYFDERGEVKKDAVQHAIETVEEMKAEGIYSYFSIYFPLWLAPKPDTPWLQGYDGNKKPFAALYFNREFQEKYRNWWKALLTTPGGKGGKRLVDEPAVAGLEIINEDSFFFWTFNTDAVPDPQLRILEKMFGAWLGKKHGSIEAALEKWGGLKLPRDAPAEGRAAFRPLWNMFNEKKERDRDTARFLVEVQRGFYRDTYRFLRDLGFKGVITASNWATASPQVFGPLEKYTYTACDFIDRHGYFGCRLQGQFSEWSIREGHTYFDRSALRFEPESPGKPKQFNHPVMDPSYDGKPSMISETTFNRPNRYRSEAPLFYAAYGALQDSDGIVHFALDSTRWTVKPGFFMQPWTLMAPAMMGQFPAAALIYRKGLVATGEMLVDLNLKVEDILDLEGTPLPQDAAFDELRLKDVPAGAELRPGSVIDPLVHFAGRTNVSFTEEGGAPKLRDLKPFIDRARQTVTSSTGELKLDYGKGVLTIDAPSAQGASGALKDAGPADLKDISIASDLELGHIVAVSLDERPLASSRKILLQAMSEEKNGSFRTEPAAAPVQRIASIGQDPWMVRELSGTVRFKRPDAAKLKVTVLDPNGSPILEIGNAAGFKLKPDALYYLIAP